MSRARLLDLAACALIAVAGGCRGAERSASDYEVGPSRYDYIPAPDQIALREARAALDRGEHESARAELERIAARNPEHVGLAIALQELAFARAAQAERAQLATDARELAEREPNVPHLLLAARLDADAARSRATLERALDLDGECAWAHYALAHLDARESRWTEARQRCSRALALDPGHLSARRLEAQILARAGQRSEAIAALEIWLEVTRGEPLIDAPTRVLAELDLAQLRLLEGDESGARELLVSLADQPTEPVRRLCLLAAVELALGRAERALTAARDAEVRDADAVLPLVQQALLQEHALDDPAAARRAWERVLAVSSTGGDLNALILGLRARVALERAAPVEP